MRLRHISLPLAAVLLAWAAAESPLPNRQGSVKLAIIGDSGTGDKPQFEVAARMVEARARFPFTDVLMLGDNLYGRERESDYRSKFERPYQPLLSAGVRFHAVLGNHDDPAQTRYPAFNMGGQRYYTFRLGKAQFFALDSNYMDAKQMAWIEAELKRSDALWKIALSHHPLYSSGERHGSDVQLRAFLEPLFVRYGVNIALAGHEHFYERIKPQRGVWYFICGGSAKLRRGNIGRSELTAAGLDTDNSFLMMEIEDEQIAFQAVSRAGRTFDSGVISRTALKPAAASGAAR